MLKGVRHNSCPSGQEKVATLRAEHLMILLAGSILLAAIQVTIASEQKRKEYFQRPGVKVSEIVKARGYLAQEHTFVTDDGYVVGMTRALNPLIGWERRIRLQRRPLLFIHGTLVDGNSFVMNSFDIEQPKDFTRIDPDKLDEQQLIELFKDEPSSKSLAFFALNFGHEVWFLHRRGSPMSQKRMERAANHSRSPTVMEKYLMSVEEHKRRRTRARTQDRKRLKRYWRDKRSLSAELDESPDATDDKFDAEETERVTRRPVIGSFPGGEGEIKSKGDKKRDNSKVIEALGAAPAALFDYGNLAMDIKITLNKRLWNHSLDEQAAYDLPRAVDYVLEQTGHERAVIVGDSSGGALILMSLVLEPMLSDKQQHQTNRLNMKSVFNSAFNAKVSKAIAWVPSFNIGHTQDSQHFLQLQPLFDYIGPFPFTFASNPFQALMEVACSLEVMQVTLCELVVDTNWGNSAGQAPLRPEFQSTFMTPVSAHEYLQLIQFVTRKQTRMFDFRDKHKNMIAYGQEDPPYYNVSLIDFDYLSIYVGTSDLLVTEKDIETIHRELKVPHKIRVMNEPGVNHAGALFHKNIARVVIIPTYKDIISHGYRSPARGRDGYKSRRDER